LSELLVDRLVLVHDQVDLAVEHREIDGLPIDSNGVVRTCLVTRVGRAESTALIQGDRCYTNDECDHDEPDDRLLVALEER